MTLTEVSSPTYMYFFPVLILGVRGEEFTAGEVRVPPTVEPCSGQGREVPADVSAVMGRSGQGRPVLLSWPSRFPSAPTPRGGARPSGAVVVRILSAVGLETQGP